jgi:hypothetical protein
VKGNETTPGLYQTVLGISLSDTGWPIFCPPTTVVETPDHTRHWTTYQEVGMINIYNTSFADDDATIYSILLSG